jgi:alpha-beta hydrolase superfamily lysophospholipase/RimJ/RimL family protein N-acetyltransferase
MPGQMAPVTTPDGVQLHVRDVDPPAGTPRRGSVLIVHGLGEHSGRYAHVAGALAALGLRVRAYDHRGHGRSGGPRGGIPHADALLDDLRLVFDGLAAEAPGEPPPFLLGHSMGGTVAARATAGGWVAPRGLILSSPALAAPVSRAQRLLAAVARRTMPDRAVPNGLPVDGLSREPATVAEYRADPDVHDRISTRLFDFIVDAGAATRADAGRIAVPTLLLVAGQDRLVDPAGSREFAAALADGIGTVHVYEDLFHEVFNERASDRERVLGDLTAWVEAQLAPTPRATPAREPIAGRLVRLEPLDADRHGGDLFAAADTAGDPELWTYLPYGPFADQAEIHAHLSAQAASADPLFFAVVDAASGRAGGVVSYLRIEPAHRVIEIGHIWFGAALQRTPQATEAIYLLARHAFDDLGLRRLEWKCNAANARSRRAAERFGFTFEGVFRQHMIVKGRNRDTAWFAILDGEWPAIRSAFEAWLDPANFGPDGRQHRSLAELRTG